MSDDEIREKLGSLVNNVMELRKQGADLATMELCDASFDIVKLWLDNPDRIKWSFWHGKNPKETNLVDLYPVGEGK